MRPFFYRHVYWLLWLVFSTALAADDVALQKSLLWQIDQVGLTSSYLFATLHSEDPRILQLPLIVQTRFEHAKSAAIEVVMDIPSVQQFSNAMFFSGTPHLDQLLNKEIYSKIVEALRQYGLSEKLARSMKPWAVMTTLSQLPSKTGQYLEMRLYQRAMELQIPLYGLEKVAEQLQIFEELPLAEQVVLLTDTVTHLEERPKVYDKLRDLYLERDLIALRATSESYMLAQSSNHSLTKAFFKRLVEDRNLKMVNQMLPRLQKGNAFIAIGALHFPGEQGILKLLEARGYRVVAVY
jgi:hypothetical protein